MCVLHPRPQDPRSILLPAVPCPGEGDPHGRYPQASLPLGTWFGPAQGSPGKRGEEEDGVRSSCWLPPLKAAPGHLCPETKSHISSQGDFSTCLPPAVLVTGPVPARLAPSCPVVTYGPLLLHQPGVLPQPLHTPLDGPPQMAQGECVLHLLLGP